MCTYGDLLTGAVQEIKAKEMEELAKTLAELGIAAPAAANEEGAEAADDKRKKKKEKKKPKAEGNGEVSLPETNGTAKENEPMEEPAEEESSESLDPAEVSSGGPLEYAHNTSADGHDEAPKAVETFLQAAKLICTHCRHSLLTDLHRVVYSAAGQHMVRAFPQLVRRRPAHT